MKLSPEDAAFFNRRVAELLLSDKVKEMDRYIQHGNTTCLQHCIAVAYYSYGICRRFAISCDAGSVIRGAMLHDFFLYDWHDKDASHRWHGFHHPRAALANARKYYTLTAVECNIISRHMWPLTGLPPKCREAWIICLVDKACSLFETAGPYFGNRSYTKAPVYAGFRTQP